jgi:hypothetical protein
MPTLELSEELQLFAFEGVPLIYSVAARARSNRVVFVFSGIDEAPCSPRMSYYGLRDDLDATVVHVMDHFGAHGCYLLSLAGDDRVQRATLALIRRIQSSLSVSNDATHLIGTSKGATAAVLYALMLGDGHVIAGEPQIRLGDFIYDADWSETDQWRSLVYTILGEVPSDGRGRLNDLIDKILKDQAPGFKGTMTLLHGSGTGYWEQHIRHFADIAKQAKWRARVECVEEKFNDHLEVVKPFLALVKQRLS